MRKRILVVDDQDMIRRVVSLTLERAGYAVAQADNGESALEMCKEHDYDLVISDIKMPRLDGDEMLRRLREERSDMKVLMMSGYADPGAGTRVRELGAIDFLVKPFKPRDLLEICKKTLSA